MLDSTRIAEINNDIGFPVNESRAEMLAAKERSFQKLLTESKWANPARSPLNDAWADLLFDNEKAFNLVKAAMQSKDSKEERIIRARACLEIFESLERTLWEWSE